MLTADGLSGVYPAIVTPFDSKEEIDEVSLRRLVRYLLEGGVHAIMTTGGTGEFPHLSREERRRVAAVVVEEVGGRFPIIAGTAASSTREAILLSQDAEEAGASAVILTPPYYFRLPPTSLLQHFREVAAALDLPVLVYNNPLYTGNNLSPAMLAELSGVQGIIGCKQSNDDMGQLVETIRLCGQKFSVNTGIDSQFYPALCVGARGIFSTAACVIPRQMVEIDRLFRAGRHEEARDLHMKVQVLNRFLEYDPGYVAPCKEALEMLGIPGGAARRPMPALTPEERSGIREALRQLELI